MTYSGFYLRRTSAESAFRACHRRGWDPVLRRVLGLWVVRVSIEPLQTVGGGVAPESGLIRSRQPASR